MWVVDGFWESERGREMVKSMKMKYKKVDKKKGKKIQN